MLAGGPSLAYAQTLVQNSQDAIILTGYQDEESPGRALLDLARHLLGPAGGTPVQAAAVAEAWFGQAVDRSTVERFARVLEGIGLVRRDDERRDRLWVLGPQDTHLFPEEAELEEQLKQANPKGRLLEFCMRQRIDPPQTATESQGPFYRAQMSLCYQGETLVSGPQQAASKKSAEQLAAQVLLNLVSARNSVADVIRVREEDLARLQSGNPKGQLLEWCAKQKWPAPQFEQQASPQGYLVRALVGAESEARTCSAWHLAVTLKAAEQAAAEAVLESVRGRPAGGQTEVIASPPQQPSSPGPPGPERNAAMVLNELRQVGVLDASGYEVVHEEGPSHQPVFSTVAWSSWRSDRSEPAHVGALNSARHTILRDVSRTMTSRRKLLPLAVLVVLIGILTRSWVVSLVPTTNAMERFTPPDEKQRRSAIGTTAGLPRRLQRAVDPADHFEPIPAPGPSDWLAKHHEPGQTFAQYRQERVNRPDKIRRKLYLQPLGEFPADTSPSLEQLKQFAEAFFTLPVELRPAVDLVGLPITSRMHPGPRQRQLLTSDILAWLQTRLPKDAYCILAITMADLYPADDWNFVFGQASLRERVGVYSFARYDPGFYGEADSSRATGGS